MASLKLDMSGIVLKYFSACATAAALAASPGALAQSGTAADYPNRPVRVLNPSSLGGGGDVVARIVMPELSRLLGQNFYVENRPGAANIIATELAAKAPPDGYTIYLAAFGTFVTNPLVYAKLPYTLKSFETVTIIADAPFILSVHPALPVTNLKQLIALAKANPGQLTFASFGTGSTPHLTGELLQSLTGTKMLHVPYKGSAPGMADLMAGNITMTIDGGLASIPQIRAKRIRAIGVTAPVRLAVLPEVPTFDEIGLPKFYVGSWYGIMAPAKTPRDIVMKLHGGLLKAVANPAVRDPLQNLGAAIVGNSPDEFAAQVVREQERWAEVVKKAGIKPE
jgi:tripartite-type tricarboxylate transporter receptor subunit TctC